MSSEQLSLFELNHLIKESLLDAFPVTYWIVAEISEIRQNRTGHCYLELVEKDNESDQIIAKSRATIWASSYRLIKPYFEMTTGESLRDGLKVLVNITVEFHELYSFSLNIKDIDPNYTMGDLARMRQEIILRLEEEGVMNMNREIDLAEIPQRIAIISSQTAAGLDDFISQIENNEFGYKFYLKVFPATVQGAQAEESIMSALDRVYEYEDFFDAVALIRGGGSRSDLSCFDGYNLAYYITQFPLPLVTGIGHERDDSIADLVAHTRMKTPTAVAEFFIARIADFEISVTELSSRLADGLGAQLDEANHNLNEQSYRFLPLVNRNISSKKDELLLLSSQVSGMSKNLIHSQNQQLNSLQSFAKNAFDLQVNRKRNQLDLFVDGIAHSIERHIMKQQHVLQMIESKNNNLDPQHILNRGYSMTTKNGKIIKDSRDVLPDDTLVTKFAKGRITSTVKKIED
jgi:exodeoxyribonuclease VII large subunit